MAAKEENMVEGTSDGHEVVQQAFLRKKSTNMLNQINWRRRWFLLTKTTLYYSGTGSMRGQKAELKQVDLSRVEWVERVDREEGRQKWVFQVYHRTPNVAPDQQILYIAAESNEMRDTWLTKIRDVVKDNQNLSSWYHPLPYANGKWGCCHQSARSVTPCKTTTPFVSSETDTYEQVTGAELERNRTAAAQARTTKQEVVIVEALYDYHEPGCQDDIRLKKGDHLEVLESHNENWWLLRNVHTGEQGYAPACYIQPRDDSYLHGYEWYMGPVGVQEAEASLHKVRQRGSFRVRASLTKPGYYTLSVYHRGGKIRHLHIRRDAHGFYFLTPELRAPSLLDLLLLHHTKEGGMGLLLIHYQNGTIGPSPHGAWPPQLDKDKWEMEEKELQLLEPVSNNMRRGRVRTLQVIVKVKGLNETPANFFYEARVMSALSHKNLMTLHGVVSARGYIVVEHLAHGPLLSYLRTPHHHKPLLLLHFCGQICSALSFLQSQSVIHRDVRAINCLVGSDNLVKLGNLARARFVRRPSYKDTGTENFVVKWAAPEVLKERLYSSASDVWAFAVTCWEVFSLGNIPYGRSSNAMVVSDVKQGRTLDQPDLCPHYVYQIMVKCWSFKKSQRPSFAQLEEIFTQPLRRDDWQGEEEDEEDEETEEEDEEDEDDEEEYEEMEMT